MDTSSVTRLRLVEGQLLCRKKYPVDEGPHTLPESKLPALPMLASDRLEPEGAELNTWLHCALVSEVPTAVPSLSPGGPLITVWLLPEQPADPLSLVCRHVPLTNSRETLRGRAGPHRGRGRVTRRDSEQTSALHEHLHPSPAPLPGGPSELPPTTTHTHAQKMAGAASRPVPYMI